MVFSDTTNYAGMIQECERMVFSSDYGRISNNTNLLKEFTTYLNHGLDEVTIKILQADGRWEFDDSEHTDQPIGTTDLVADQTDYAISITHLVIKRVEAKDSAGNWVRLRQKDNRDIWQAVDEFKETSGEPFWYDLQGDRIKLYPASSYNSTAGLKVYYQRPMDYFATSDTTKAPGFASIFHRMVPMWASYFYASYNQMDVAGAFRSEIALKEKDLQQFFRSRNEERLNRVVPKYKSSR